MGVRLRNYFYSLGGVYWQIDIMDSLYSGSITEFTTAQEGFTPSYKGLTEREDAIMASDVIVHALINSGDGMDELMTDMTSSLEERFGVMIYRNSSVFWCGVALPDLLEVKDEYYPLDVNLRFSDGLARLKDKNYNQEVWTAYGLMPTPYTGRDTFIAHLIKILTNTGIMAYWGTNDLFLKTCVHWYDIHHDPSAAMDPLKYSDVDHQAFHSRIKDDLTYDYKTCYDVLEMILNTFNARIFQSGGCYYIVQSEGYAMESMTYRNYKKDGTYISNNSINPTYLEAQRLAGGISKFYPSLKEVTKIYNYWYEELLPLQTYYTTGVALYDTVTGSIGQFIHFKGAINEIYYGGIAPYLPTIPASFGTTYFMKVILAPIGGGSLLYLTNKNGYYQWSLTSTDKVIIYSTVMPSGVFWTESTDIDFITPVIPTGGSFNALFQLMVVDHHDNNGVITLPGSVTWSYGCNKFSMTAHDNGDAPDDGMIKNWAINLDSGGVIVKSTVSIAVKDTSIGDGHKLRSAGRIKAYGGSTWVNSTAWGVHDSSTRTIINSLSVQQNLLPQKIPVERFMGTFTDVDLLPHLAVLFGSKVMVPVSMNMKPSMDEISGEWFSVTVPTGDAGVAAIDSPGVIHSYRLPQRVSTLEKSSYITTPTTVTENTTLTDIIPIGYKLLSIDTYSESLVTISIGTTPGGDDVVSGVDCNGSYSIETNKWSKLAPLTLYISSSSWPVAVDFYFSIQRIT